MKNFKQGFTLIELLVVVAIIGILSAIVLASLSGARTGAYDAKVKAQLSNLRSAAEIYYTTNFNYGTTTYPLVTAGNPNGCSGGMFTDVISGLSKLSISVNYPAGENTIICNSNGTAYAVSDNLAPSTPARYWCVDSTGTSEQESVVLATSTNVCP